MKVIVLASSKGGVGKTTLAFNLAIHAARSGAGPRRGVGVQLIDRDPAALADEPVPRRRETPELQADNPMLLDGVTTVASTIADLTDSGYARDYLIVDTPASLMSVLARGARGGRCRDRAAAGEPPRCHRPGCGTRHGGQARQARPAPVRDQPRRRALGHGRRHAARDRAALRRTGRSRSPTAPTTPARPSRRARASRSTPRRPRRSAPYGLPSRG